MGQAIDRCVRCGRMGPTSDEDVCGECYLSLARSASRDSLMRSALESLRALEARGTIPEKPEETFPRPWGVRSPYSARISTGSGYKTKLYIAREGKHLQGVHFVGSEQCGNCGQDMAAPEYQAFWSRDGRVVCGKCGEHYGVVVESAEVAP